MKKATLIMLTFIVTALISFSVGARMQKGTQEITRSDVLEHIENTLGDEYKKQTVSEIIAQLTYAHPDGSDPIYYYFVKTTYYEANPADTSGLNVNAFRVLLNPAMAETSMEMKIQDWYGCLYTFPNKSYLCWTISPEVSYIMEYDPNAVSDEEIIKMAGSATPLSPSE